MPIREKTGVDTLAKELLSHETNQAIEKKLKITFELEAQLKSSLASKIGFVVLLSLLFLLIYKII